MQNLHQLFDWQYIGQIIGGDIAKFCGLLRIYELYLGGYFVVQNLYCRSDGKTWNLDEFPSFSKQKILNHIANHFCLQFDYLV